MGRKPDLFAGAAIIAVALVTGSGCAGREARDFGGRWTPVNRYAAAAEAIPIEGVYTYQPSPMDGTLRNLLARWARDGGHELDYRHAADFTLHEPVRGVRSARLPDALAQLERAFDAHGVRMRLDGNRVVVAAGSAAGG